MHDSDQAVKAALTAVGLPNLKVVADQDDVAAMAQRPGWNTPFAEALRLALEAFLTNGQGSPDAGHDSALDVVRDAPESFGLDSAPTDAAITEALRRVLSDDPKAEIVLLTPATLEQEAYRFPPEYGERTEEHWVFRIIAPASWPFLQWAIVDPRGERPAYSYMFD
jgi:hypothetical protein